ncbi:hypothetical protein D3C83_32800 [compost metagenome]
MVSRSIATISSRSIVPTSASIDWIFSGSAISSAMPRTLPPISLAVASALAAERLVRITSLSSDA